MISEQGKLILLFVSLTLCLGTLFTSPTITMGNAELPVLRAPIDRLCSAPRDQAHNCMVTKDMPTKDCSKLRTNAKKCEDGVRKAFRHINMAGCPSELKAKTLCQAEWCSSGSDIRICNEECSHIEHALKECIETQVSEFLSKQGLNAGGGTPIRDQ